MKHILLLLSLALASANTVHAQNKLVLSQVRVVERTDTVQGSGATFDLGQAVSSAQAVILQANGLLAKSYVKFSAPEAGNAGTNAAQLHLTLDLVLSTGREKEQKRVERTIAMDGGRHAVSETFNIKAENGSRAFTLLFDLAVE